MKNIYSVQTVSDYSLLKALQNPTLTETAIFYNRAHNKMAIHAICFYTVYIWC